MRGLSVRSGARARNEATGALKSSSEPKRQPLRNLNRCLGRHLNLSGMEGVNGDALTKSKAKKRTNLELTMKIKNEMKMKRTNKT